MEESNPKYEISQGKLHLI